MTHKDNIELVIKIPEGLKKDFESEQWTALSCMEMKDALMNGTPLLKGHGRLIDVDYLDITTVTTDDYSGNEVIDIVLKEDVEDAPTIIEADTAESEDH